MNHYSEQYDEWYETKSDCIVEKQTDSDSEKLVSTCIMCGKVCRELLDHVCSDCIADKEVGGRL